MEPQNRSPFWAEGQVWLYPNARYNPDPEKFTPLARAFENPFGDLPTEDTLEQLLARVRERVPLFERDAFAVHAAVLRSTARECSAL